MPGRIKIQSCIVLLPRSLAKKMSRFFIPQDCIKANTALVTGKEAHHILNVMRLKKGDSVQFFDGTGKLYQGKIFDTQTRELKLEIESVHQDSPLSNLEITLVQALPKKNKMDYIVEKSTELGIDVIVPLQTSRTIVKLDKTKQSELADYCSMIESGDFEEDNNHFKERVI